MYIHIWKCLLSSVTRELLGTIHIKTYLSYNHYAKLFIFKRKNIQNAPFMLLSTVEYRLGRALFRVVQISNYII